MPGRSSPNRIRRIHEPVVTRPGFIRLAVAWTTVAAMLLADPVRLVGAHPVITGLLFAWLLAVGSIRGGA